MCRVPVIFLGLALACYVVYNHKYTVKFHKQNTLKKKIQKEQKTLSSLNQLLSLKKNMVRTSDVFNSQNSDKLIKLINTKHSGLKIKEVIPLNVTNVPVMSMMSNIPREYGVFFSNKIYRANILVSLEGTFGSMVSYLKRLERYSPSIYFDRISLVVKSYPTLIINLQCHYYFTRGV